MITKLINKYIGKIEYIVTLLGVDGDIKKHTFKSIKDVDIFVYEVNNETYWDVQKIEKIRRLDFIYNKDVIHTPLWFNMENVTELHNCNNHDFSFIKKDISLKNIKRQYSKKIQETIKQCNNDDNCFKIT